MIYGPGPVRADKKEQAGIIMSVFLIGGIFMGALFSKFVMDPLIAKAPNPLVPPGPSPDAHVTLIDLLFN